MKQLVFMCLLAPLSIAAQGSEPPSSFTFHDSEDLPDLQIQPYPIPAGYEVPDISACIQDWDLPLCEKTLIEAVPLADGNMEMQLFLFGTLGTMAEWQSKDAQDPRNKEAHRERSLKYLSKAEDLAREDEDKYRIQLANVLDSQASVYEDSGDLENAILKHRELIKFTGVGTGSEKDRLAAFAIIKTAQLRLEAGHDTTAVYSFLDSFKAHGIEDVAFTSQHELFKMDLLMGDTDQATKRLEAMRIQYARRDSLGGMDMKRIFRHMDYSIQFRKDHPIGTGVRLQGDDPPGPGEEKPAGWYSMREVMEKADSPPVKATAAYALASMSIGAHMRSQYTSSQYFKTFMEQSPEKYFPSGWLYGTAYLEYSRVLWNTGKKDESLQVLAEAVANVDRKDAQAVEAIRSAIEITSRLFLESPEQEAKFKELQREFSGE